MGSIQTPKTEFSVQKNPLRAIVFIGFSWDATTHVLDLGTLCAFGINSAGTVVGYSDSRAFSNDGAMHDLGHLGGSKSCAYAINSSGQIVGGSLINSNLQEWHAFIYENGAM